MKNNESREESTKRQNSGSNKPGNNKRNRNRKPRNNKPKGKMVEENIPDRDLNMADLREQRSSDNDLGWYTKFPELINALSNFSYGQALGTKLNRIWTQYVSTVAKKTYTMSYATSYIPGIMKITYVPIIGNSSGATSAFNLAGFNLFSFQRSKNSRSQSYDMPNLMLHIEAMRSLIGLFWKLCRVYGALNFSSPFSRYEPQVLVQALGFDYNDLIQNKPQFRSIINQMAIDMNKIRIPAGLAVIERNAWINSTFFLDSDTAKAQIYLYDQTGFYRYTEATSGPQYLQLKDVDSYLSPNASYLTVANAQQMITDLLQPMLESEDIGTITADIIKAYGLENCYSVPQIAEDYTIIPSYSQEVLSQIENASLSGFWYKIADFYNSTDMAGRTNMDICEIIPEDAALGSPYVAQTVLTVQYPYGTTPTTEVRSAAAFASVASSQIINMHKQDVQIGDTVVATRMLAAPTWIKSGSSSDYVGYDTLGTELALKAVIYTFNDNTSAYPYGNAQSIVFRSNEAVITTSDLINVMHKASVWSSFDWAPQLRFVFVDTSTEGEIHTSAYEIKDFDNYITITPGELADINEACLRSEYLVDYTSRASKEPYKK